MYKGENSEEEEAERGKLQNCAFCPKVTDKPSEMSFLLEFVN